MTAETNAPVGSLEGALAHAARLLQAQPALAVRQAEEILAAIPGQPDAVRLLARGQWASGDPEAAIRTLSARTITSSPPASLAKTVTPASSCS